MKTKSIRNSAAALCASAFTLIITTSMAQAGGTGARTIFGMESVAAPVRTPITIQPITPTAPSAAVAMTPVSIDDPINHDANDVKQAAQPADDHGRRHGRGR